MHEAGTEVGGQKIKPRPPHLLSCRGGAGITLGVCVCARRSLFGVVRFALEINNIKLKPKGPFTPSLVSPCASR